MPKRKASSSSSSSRLTTASVDAALDVLATETFERLHHLVVKFKEASGIELGEEAAKCRWEEACKRHWVMKSLEDLTCGSKVAGGDDDMGEAGQSHEGRPLPSRLHQGTAVTHNLNPAEELEWKKWSPQLSAVVLVELADGQIWPGKIIDRQRFFQGRTAARGSSFFPIRIYSKDLEPVLSIKSRLVPFDMRPDPPLLASPSLLTAYHHARHPESFDKVAEQREKDAAQARVTADPEDAKAAKAAWNAQVNWIMNERRVEKMRNLHHERDKRAKAEQTDDDDLRRKRNCPDRTVDAGIFKLPTAVTSPLRPISPRRPDKKRIYSGLGEYSPRGRGRTYTPPRILPSGDETAVSPSPVPSARRFDFVSPMGPPRDVERGSRRASLEAVKEESPEDDGEWQVVHRRSRRGDSAPCKESQDTMET